MVWIRSTVLVAQVGRLRTRPGTGVPFNAVKNHWVLVALGSVISSVSLRKPPPLYGFTRL